MRRSELDILISWASNEGWNPGRYDADIFWNTDPKGFIAAELDGKLIGGGSIVTYQKQFGFMGFFIIKPEFRSQGLGTKLWFARREKLQARLNSHASIGMDGVFEMQSFYTKGGFEFAHREIRFEGPGQPCSPSSSLTPLSEIPFTTVLQYDTAHFPAHIVPKTGANLEYQDFNPDMLAPQIWGYKSPGKPGHPARNFEFAVARRLGS